MAETVRIGVIGLGSVAGAYVPHIRRLAMENIPCEIVIACDTRPGQAEQAREWGIPDFTTEPDDVLGRADVDLVLILTAMPSHGPITRAALEAGKHVLVEKPISVDLADAAEIVALSKSSKGHLVCAPHVTLSPVYQDLWRHIRAGDIGRPLSARGFYGWAGPDWTSWFYEPGGGPVFDLGVYNITTLTGLLGPAKRVIAMGNIAIPKRIVANREIDVAVEDNVHIVMEFADQCLASIVTGFTMQKYRTPGIEIYGSEGTVQMLGDDWGPSGYELWRNDRACWEVHEVGGGWRWTDGIRDLIEAIQQGRDPVNGPEHAYHVLEVMTKCHESIRNGQALPIVSSFDPPHFDRTADRVAPHLIHAPE